MFFKRLKDFIEADVHPERKVKRTTKRQFRLAAAILLAVCLILLGLTGYAGIRVLEFRTAPVMQKTITLSSAAVSPASESARAFLLLTDEEGKGYVLPEHFGGESFLSICERIEEQKTLDLTLIGKSGAVIIQMVMDGETMLDQSANDALYRRSTGTMSTAFVVCLIFALLFGGLGAEMLRRSAAAQTA